MTSYPFVVSDEMTTKLEIGASLKMSAGNKMQLVLPITFLPHEQLTQ